MHKDPVKLIIVLGFAGVLTLMLLISVISLSQMKSITDRISDLHEETSAKITAANTMRDSIRLRGDTLYKMYLTDDYIERDEYRLELAEHALKYKLARDTLSSYRTTSREAKLLDQLLNQTVIAKAFNDDAADILLSDEEYEKVRQSMKLANTARHEMLEGLNRLVILQEEIAHELLNDARRYQERISNIITVLSLIAFFIAIYIAQLVIRETGKKNSEIRYQATHDELTKLVNRKEFNIRLRETFLSAKQNNENHALCFLDLDNFKTVNDSCGHKAGDELLIQLTRLIKSNIRSNDTLARIGGDEFGLLLQGCSLDKAIEISEGIVSLIKHHEFNWLDKNYHVGVSIGLVMVDHNTPSIEQALSQADIACYAAKDMGRNQVHTHGLNDDRAKQIHKELSWVAEINNTQEHERFSLYLQPIKNIQEESVTTMFEVLLRLNDDEGTLISPGSYIPAAERFSLMSDVDHWVIEQSFNYLSQLYKTVPNCHAQFFINISSNSLTNHLFTDFVIEHYKKYNITHHAVCLEISENKAVKNINQTCDMINALRKYDIKFSLDDFGEGVSSFSYLKNLHVDYLKINGEIVKNMAHNTADKAMVAAINEIGRVMNIKTIAEHVENIFTLNQLKEMGINYAQGFYFSRPKDIIEQVEEIKQSGKQRSAH